VTLQPCHIIIVGVGVAACHTPIVVPLGQHLHLFPRAVACRLGGGAENIIDPSISCLEQGGVASRWGWLAVMWHRCGCGWATYLAGIPLGSPSVPPDPPD